MDNIIDLYHALREPYRRNAIFITNDATVKAIRKLKDGSGAIPMAAVCAGRSARYDPEQTGSDINLCTYNFRIRKNIAFGDFKHYWIPDRQGRSFQRLNELYAATGQVGFRATQRVDGKLTLGEAVKVLQMKA